MPMERYSSLESQWATANGWRMHARGAAPALSPVRLPVVLIHGLSVSSRYLMPTAMRFAADRQVYAPDLPGFGRSEQPPVALPIHELADTLAAWMQGMQLERAILLGHSFGCQILAELALRHPSRLAQAIFVAPTIEPQSRTAIRQVVYLLRDAWREPLDLLPLVLSDYYRAGLARTIRTLRYALQDVIESKLPQVQVPSLVVRGARDPIVSPQWAEAVARLVPCGRLVVIPRVAHAVPYSASVELVQAIEAFLTTLPERTPSPGV